MKETVAADRQLDTQALLKAYELTINEEHRFLTAHQTHAAFYAGVVTALVAGTGAGLFNATEWFHFAFLLSGPALAVGVCAIAVQGLRRQYQRFLEAVTVRAKLESLLGFTTLTVTSSYWAGESLIPVRYVNSRTAFTSSKEFVSMNLNRGANGVSAIFFRCLAGASGLMFFGILGATISRLL